MTFNSQVTFKFTPIIPDVEINVRAMIRSFAALERRYVDRAVKYLKRYPPERPRQVYRRTGTLGRSWFTVGPVQVADALIMDFANNAHDSRHHYAQFVYGPFQDAVHRGRWPFLATDPNVLDQTAFERDVYDIIARNIRVSTK